MYPFCVKVSFELITLEIYYCDQNFSVENTIQVSSVEATAADKARQLFCLWLQLLFCRINLFAFNAWAQSSRSFVQRAGDYY